jgi:formylglycine-generating enzyme required for sulfatase activity
VLIWLFSCTVEPICPAGMVPIDGGRYTVGVEVVRHKWEAPASQVDISAFCIDRYEYPNQKGAMPKGGVTYGQAEALCAGEGKRLCLSAEWERACRGQERWRYSYGPTRDADACNTPIEGGGPGDEPPPIAPSGSYGRCVTPEGVYDLNGSLSEWVSDPWSGFPEPFNRNAKVDPASWRTLRGGTMWSNTFYGQDCTSRHGHNKSRWKNMDDGFRCCAEPINMKR